MKRRVLILVACLAGMLFLCVGCGNKYSEVEKLNKEFIELTEEYVADLDKADDAKDVAKAINRYADGMEDLWPKMRAISEKYPELKDRNNPPEELKESQKKAEEVGIKMAGTMRKVMPYMRDPAVRKAQQRIQAVMTHQ